MWLELGSFCQAIRLKFFWHCSHCNNPRFIRFSLVSQVVRISWGLLHDGQYMGVVSWDSGWVFCFSNHCAAGPGVAAQLGHVFWLAPFSIVGK